MNLLLDTHIFLWVLSAPDRLSAKARKHIIDPNNAVFVSAVSGWEIAIKKQLGKLKAPDEIFGEIEKRGMSELPLHLAHTEMLETLPLHHQDPFDRMLVAQALHENYTLVTADKKLHRYNANIL